MKRHVVAGLALLALGGCAQERAAQRQGQGYSYPVGLPPEGAPISQTINRGLPPPDPAAVMASAGVGANKGPARGRPVNPADSGGSLATDTRQPAPSIANVPPSGLPGAMPSTPLVPSDPREIVAAPASEPGPATVASETQPLPIREEALRPEAAAAVMPQSAAVTETAPSPASVASAAPDAAQAGAIPAPAGETTPASGVVNAEPAAPNPAPVAATSTNPEPVAAASDPAPVAEPAPSPIPLEVVPGQQGPHAGSPAPVATAAPTPTPEPVAPTAERTPVPRSIPLEPAPSGEVPDAVSNLTGPPTQAATGNRDPLLGKNPDVMPDLDVPPRSPDAGVAPASGAGPLPALPPIEGAAPPTDGTDVMPRIEAAPAPSQGAVRSQAPPALMPVEAPPVPAGRDPLLGANPPLSPDMGAPPALPAVASSAPVAPLPPVEAPPAPSAPAPAAGPAPTSDVMPLFEAPPSAAPQPAPAPTALPPAAAPPAASPSVTPAPNPPAPQAAREGAKTDPALTQVRADATTVQSNVTVQSDLSSPKMEEASRIAARVGDDAITMTELSAAVKERVRKQFPGQKLSRKEIEMFVAFTLSDLVDRSLIMQEAKRKLKDPKKFQTVLDAADNVFKDHEVPALMRKYHVDSQKALKDALIADDSSFERARENFRYQFIIGGYIEQQLGAKRKVDLPEKRAYYNQHLKEFDRPAQITWREVVVEVKKSPNRPEAYRRAEGVLARLRRGDDFAKLAETESDGPTKKQGGRWQTRPGGYAVESVNRALETLPVGQVSPIIEGPTSYHIVLVEERREAGPARFDEVQDEIEAAVAEEKHAAITSAFIQKLRSQAYVRTMFDGTPNDPAVLRATFGKRPQAPAK